MNPAFQDILAAKDEDRRGLFLATATRIGTTVQNIEKDFWVCWTLDALFHRLKAGGPRLLFKGGTSLSKVYGLISRFSEDIDVTVFREDLGMAVSVEELEGLSKSKRGRTLDALKAACQRYIQSSLGPELDAWGKGSLESAGRNPAGLQVTVDDADPDRQSLKIDYPSVVEASPYYPSSVKIESGAKSALDPHAPQTISPYLSDDLSDPKAGAVPGVVTIDVERTFMDKVLILHGMPFHFAATGQLRGDGRMSRHYYDIHRLMAAPVGAKACADAALITDCVRHSRMFFHRANDGLESAAPGSFRLQPTEEMIAPLARDYAAMSTMIFGDIPDFREVLESVARAEAILNAT